MQRPIDIGISLDRGLSSEGVEAIERSLRRMREILEQDLGSFAWRVHTFDGDERSGETMVRLDTALAALERQRFDFVIDVTQEALVDPHQRKMVAVASNLLNVGVVSLADALGAESPVEARAGAIERRMLIVLAALNGIHQGDRSVGGGQWLTPAGKEELRQQLESVADERAEEGEGPALSDLGFAVKSLWVARSELLQVLLRGKPWVFPFRLPKLMAGACSAGVFVLLTAEAWELGAAQSWPGILLMSFIVWLTTVSFLLVRSGTPRHRVARRSEQRVVARVATVSGVAIGMLLTFILAATFSLGLEATLYPADLVAAWTGADFGVGPLLKVAAFVASVGLGVGALGASLDSPAFFKYAVVVSEELFSEDENRFVARPL